MDPNVIAAGVEALGFATVEAILTESEITNLLGLVPQVRAGMRNLLTLPYIAHLAQHPKVIRYVHSILGRNAFAFKATFFDKHPEANWLVPWHQDLTLPVEQQLELPGWGPWSTKAGVIYVQPPTPILEEILAVRVHLDSCSAHNGVLQVVPQTHQLGRLDPDQITVLRQQIQSHQCAVSAGGIVLMRPLLLHASSKSKVVGHRRVIHFEYAAKQLLAPYPKLVSA